MSEREIDLARRLEIEVSSQMSGDVSEVRDALTCLLAGGHLLLEGLPGVGKTRLAKAIATALGGELGRVQGTADTLPTDITGTTVFSPADGSWSVRKGPVFANIVLFDEINRASPRAQSALLEPMEERQVTIDDETFPLPQPFLVIATQNPHGQAGAFPLPESQLDRFAMTVTLGYPGRDAEAAMLTHHHSLDTSRGQAVTDPTELSAAIDAIRSAPVAPELVTYVLDLVDGTRSHPGLALGASPRAAIGVVRAATAHSVLAGHGYPTPDDVQAVLIPSLAHRVVPAPGRAAPTAALLTEVVAVTPVPRLG